MQIYVTNFGASRSGVKMCKGIPQELYLSDVSKSNYQKSPSLKHVFITLFPLVMQVETKYTPEIYFLKKAPRSRTIFRFFFWSSAMFFFVIFVCHFSPSASSILTVMLVMNLDHQAEWEFLNGGRNWKFEELRVVSVEQKDRHLDLWKGIPKWYFCTCFFFSRFYGGKRNRKGCRFSWYFYPYRFLVEDCMLNSWIILVKPLHQHFFTEIHKVDCIIAS